MMLPEKYATIDTRPGRVSLRGGVESVWWGFMNMAPGNVIDPGILR